MTKNIYLFFLYTIIALIIDLTTSAVSSLYAPQLLLIFLMHTLYNNRANYQKYSLLLGLEIISFIRFDKVGLALFILLPLILQFQYVKDYIFLKLLAPCMYIFIYNCWQAWFAAYHFGHHYHFVHPIIQTSINCCCFLFLEKIYNQE